MEGISLIEGKELDQIKRRLEAIEQNQLALMKMLQQFVPQKTASTVPDFISISDASKKYHVSTQTIYNKMKLFHLTYEREIDRIQSGLHYLINEVELQKAIRLKGDKPNFRKKIRLRKVA